MRNIEILFILQILLFIKVNSSLIEDIDQELLWKENSKCMDPFNKSSEIDVDKCVAISPTLNLIGKNKGKCCKISMTIDPLLNYKDFYSENWKQEIIKEFNLDEDITEEEIRSKYLPSKKENRCYMSIDYVKDLMLYDISLRTVNKEVKYDCGNGEEIFKVKDYHPTNEDEIFDKEFIDCTSEFIEKDCNKRSMKLTSDDLQCCWCEKTYLSESIYDIQTLKECKPFRISKLKKVLQDALKTIKGYDERVEFKCDCHNKNGNIVKAGFNSVTGDIFIE